MARIQISKIQHRSGNIADLPTIDEAEIGYATDARRLFIGAGPDAGNINIEVFTAQANVDNVTFNTITTKSLTTGASTTPGTMTGQWTLTSGSTFYTFAGDLAECYLADDHYEPGVVLEFGGKHEVTVASDESMKVAGVVTTNPAYVLNSMAKSDHVVAIALVGRVPVKVRGTIHKGDMLVSGGDGYARPTHSPKIGTVIGKALQDFDGGVGTIEVAVARH
jgi:hypothetical protein